MKNYKLTILECERGTESGCVECQVDIRYAWDDKKAEKEAKKFVDKFFPGRAYEIASQDTSWKTVFSTGSEIDEG